MSGSAQDGGKIIGEGGFGCIIKPGFTCKGKEMKTDKFVTKIQVKNSTAERELNIGKIVKQIPSYRQRFGPIISSCKYNSKIVKMVSRREECDIVSRKPNKKFILSKLQLIKGEEFKKYLLHNVNNDMIYTLIHSYISLLYSIFLLNKQGVIHYDIKGENVMYNTEKKVPIIIDFGLSLNKRHIMPAFHDPDYNNRLEDYFYVYSPEYSLWCLDIHYITFLVQEPNLDVKSEIPYMVDEYIKYNKLFRTMSPVFVERFKELSIKQLNKYEEMGREAAISYIIKYCDTWDTYSLSIMFLRFLDLFADEFDVEFFKMIEMILSINMHPDPSQRFSALETYNYILEYLKTISHKDKSEIKKIIGNINKNVASIKNKLKKQIKYDDALSQKMSVFKQNH